VNGDGRPGLTLGEMVRVLQNILSVYKKRYDEMAELISLELGGKSPNILFAEIIKKTLYSLKTQSTKQSITPIG